PSSNRGNLNCETSVIQRVREELAEGALAVWPEANHVGCDHCVGRAIRVRARSARRISHLGYEHVAGPSDVRREVLRLLRVNERVALVLEASRYDVTHEDNRN